MPHEQHPPRSHDSIGPSARKSRAGLVFGISSLLFLGACSLVKDEPRKDQPADNLPPLVEQDIASLGAPAPTHVAPQEDGEAQINSDIPHIVVIRNKGNAIVGTWNAGTGQRSRQHVACFEALQRLRGAERLKKDFPEICEDVQIREIKAG